MSNQTKSYVVFLTARSPDVIDDSCTRSMNTADFNELSELEKRHFYKCSECGEMVDRRKLDDVLFHETDHKPRPD